jgi:hypothetical protein
MRGPPEMATPSGYGSSRRQDESAASAGGLSDSTHRAGSLRRFEVLLDRQLAFADRSEPRGVGNLGLDRKALDPMPPGHCRVGASWVCAGRSTGACRKFERGLPVVLPCAHGALSDIRARARVKQERVRTSRAPWLARRLVRARIHRSARRSAVLGAPTRGSRDVDAPSTRSRLWETSER